MHNIMCKFVSSVCMHAISSYRHYRIAIATSCYVELMKCRSFLYITISYVPIIKHIDVYEV